MSYSDSCCIVVTTSYNYILSLHLQIVLLIKNTVRVPLEAKLLLFDQNLNVNILYDQVICQHYSKNISCRKANTITEISLKNPKSN